MSICDATTLDKILRPSSTTAAAVSSHDDSIPKILTPLLTVRLSISPQQFHAIRGPSVTAGFTRPRHTRSLSLSLSFPLVIVILVKLDGPKQFENLLLFTP